MEEIFYAKSVDTYGHQETVKEHLSKVALLAKKFGEELGREKEAYVCGLFHDFGKYSQSFQEVLLGRRSGIDHALGGAAFIYCSILKKGGRERFFPIIEAIYGHHDGLFSFSEIEKDIKDSYSGPITCLSNKESALSGTEEYAKAKRAFQRDFPEFRFPKWEVAFYGLEERVKEMLHTRMLFSCLIDADYSASAGKLEWEQNPLQPEKLLVALAEYRQKIKKNSTSDLALNHLRDDVFECCGKAGIMQKPGIFTLTTPTGTGKTLALLHFALQHCKQYQKRRIIVVLPFLTLTEQSEQVYGQIIPDIFSDHSLSKKKKEEKEEESEEEKELAARWDVPFLITTSVKFFESLFSRKPGECRKLHNIADSVILFDEAQSLSPELIPATLQAVQTLCESYRCSMVFSTATQPNYAALTQLSWKATEIYPEYPLLYQALRRTQVTWRLDISTSLEQIAEEMVREKSVCTIVNLHRHARKLYEALKPLCEEDSLFYLTTDLCPAHRSQRIQDIQERLAKKLPCYVVSTQCIEAGVDLDFDVLYRALAPLEAIIQAAGRCNRNGRLQMGSVIVFEPKDEKNIYPGNWYQEAAITVKEMLKTDGLDIHDPRCITDYYGKLFPRLKEDKELTKALNEYCYEAVEKAYQLIKEQGVQVIVPYSEEQELFQEVCMGIRKQGLTADFIRQAATITVSTYEEEKVKLHGEPLYFRSDRKHSYPSGYYLLLPGHESCYTEEMGIQFPELAVENFMS